MEQATEIHQLALETPIGFLVAETITGEELTKVFFADKKPEVMDGNQPLLVEAKRQLAAFFEKKLQAFDLPLATQGTSFQQAVWEAVRQLPFGETTNYGAIANKLGDKNRMRAVGMANGKNPWAIVVPCHRVIGADGSLTGYAGGLWRKKWLLEYEKPSAQLSFF